MASNLPKSPNSYCNRVGHQQIARFLLSMQLSLLDSVTLLRKFVKKSKLNYFSVFCSLLDKMLENEFQHGKIGFWKSFDQFAQLQNFDASIRNHCKIRIKKLNLKKSAKIIKNVLFEFFMSKKVKL